MSYLQKRQAGKQASPKVIGSSSVRSSVRPEFRQNGQNDDNQSNEQSTDFPGTETTTQQPTPSSPVSALELRLREQIRRIISKISNMTCVMQEIGLVSGQLEFFLDSHSILHLINCFTLVMCE